MKQILSIVCVLLLLLSLVACGSTEPTDSLESAISDLTIPDDVVEEILEDAMDTITEETEASKEMLPFEEIVVVDNEYCSIKITGIDEDNLWGYSLKALLENKSADKTFMFAIDSASINGVKVDPLFASEVAAGKKSNEEISINTDILEDNGIKTFSDIELSFRVYDSNDWLADPVAEVTTNVYPYGEDNAEKFVRDAQPTDTVLVDNEYATVVLTGCEKDDIWGYSANVFIVNKTDTTIMTSVSEASINGFMIDPLFAEAVGIGKCSFSSITWFNSDLEDNSITEVENIEFVLRIYDNEDWMADDFYNEIVTITP